MTTFSTRPPEGGKPSLSSDVLRRVQHWLLLGRAFLTIAELCGTVSLRSEPYARRVLAFMLHQACEAFFNAIVALVSPAERRRLKDERATAVVEAERATEAAAVRSHDLGQLHYFAAVICPEVEPAMPVTHADDARLFELLSSAYVRARYSEQRYLAVATEAKASELPHVHGRLSFLARLLWGGVMAPASVVAELDRFALERRTMPRGAPPARRTARASTRIS